MRETLQKLIQLQRLDDELHDLRQLRQKLEGLEKENREGLSFFNELLDKQRSHIEEAEAFIAEKERDIQEMEEAARRTRGRFNQITSQRELTAYNKESDTQRHLKQQHTEEINKVKVQLEETRESYAQKSQDREALSAQMQAAEQALREEIAVREAKTHEVNAQRAQIRKALPAATRSRYDRTAKARGGLAVADAQSGSCSACHLGVPPLQQQKLLKMDTLEICQSCHRVLIDHSLFASEADPAEG